MLSIVINNFFMGSKLEVCIDNLGGLEACIAGNADRIELCSLLIKDGLTPTIELMEQASIISIPIRVMIRPKPGNFIFSSFDLKKMLNDIDTVKSFGFEGIVIGSTLASRELDKDVLKALINRASGLRKTLHRAIDTIFNPVGAVETAINLGFDCILSSGGSKNAVDGLSTLKEMKKRASGRIEIMPGSGINPENAQSISSAGFNWLHSSCSSNLRNNSITDINKIKNIKNAID
jgi:copper homeostasis protein|tara:strand:- start:298 stop:999 length:702 start_codon:yes stop_codon:yes gene_type:complete